MNVADLKSILETFPPEAEILVPYEWDYCCYKRVRFIGLKTYYVNEFDDPEVTDDDKKIEMLNQNGVEILKGLVIK